MKKALDDGRLEIPASSLRSRGTDNSRGHNTLLAHAMPSPEGDKNISAALEVLLEYRDPAILATSTRGNHLPSAENKVMRLLLPVSAPERQSLPLSQIFSDCGGVRRSWQKIDELEQAVSSNKSLISGLGIIPDYRKASRAPGAEGHPQPDAA
ncbi:hypothetical protein IVB56_15550 [Bradyrhizobium sp. CW7]|uniref:hypothetical protein n=1 Tax=Bradyrhizobium sp. CW7 TaxID=2782688 RepID=UPI001FF7F513|nr:hypothetical protein [Bradyrhizobium sp. CW7]MCK1352469.1 hypothetical protein [Bradyrhizobium sp. CW7]